MVWKDKLFARDSLKVSAFFGMASAVLSGDAKGLRIKEESGAGQLDDIGDSVPRLKFFCGGDLEAF